MQPQTIIFMGPQGSGKGTQAKLLVEYLGRAGTLPVFHYEAGACFREFGKRDTFTARTMHESVEAGNVQPVAFAIMFWIDAFAQNIHSHDTHIVMDGSPRKLLEARALDEMLTFYGRENRIVVHLTLDEKTAVERMLLRGRHDDTEEGIQKRLQWFAEEVRPSIEFYQADPQYRVIGIDGAPSVEEIHKSIISQLFS